ncbi:xylulokinase [Xanthobacter dioxanivorans]|uniref:Xylulose kinase n=1 Tax=Xanthobacter dioxanivorans TaxID=2528964 RepID=A0A974SIL9_9HYPH|nr:xylulokinase [Xanthobacter dioxanivorans]QRG06324.1 xylulokinase [Xanthobacter dioxanivorans]
MTADLLVGIDLGAGALKTSVIRVDGTLAGEASAAVGTSSPHPGWSEQDPAQWWRAMCETLPRALAAAGGEPTRVAAISFSAGAHTQVLEDKDGNIIRPAILWNDQRSGAETRALREAADARILELGANRANPTWTLPQMLWLKRHEPEAFARVKRLYVAKDWLRSRLTGTWETDFIDAVGTLMADIATGGWSRELCDMIGWPLETLPPIVPTTCVVGRVTAEAARATGLAEGTPVVCGTSDTAAETYGAGMVAEGLGVVKLATAATVSVLTRAPRPDFTVINYPHVMPGHWYVIAATNSCASAHKWLRDTFFRREGEDGSAVFSEMDRRAAAVAPGAEGLFFHPYLNGERSPHWDPLLRADYVGMGFNHGPGHFVRALYEGIAYSLRDCMLALNGKGLSFSTARLTGGGAKSALWRQIVADVLNVEVELPAVAEASFGAALIAGVGVGIYADARDAARVIDIVWRAAPDPERAARYAQGHRIYCDIQAALAPINHRIHDFVRGG